MIDFINNYAVKVYTLSGELVGSWSSVKEAGRALNLKHTGNVATHLSGKRKCAYGYKWERFPEIVPCLDNEHWLPAVGFEELYAVSDKGRVASLQFHGVKSFSIMKQFEDSLHYRTVKLRNWKTGYARSYPVHRLVAQAFIPNPENKPFIDHIDVNPANNNVENLRWVTPAENSRNPLTLVKLHELASQMTVSNKRIERLREEMTVMIKHNETVYSSYADAVIATKIPLSTIYKYCKLGIHGWSVLGKTKDLRYKYNGNKENPGSDIIECNREPIS